MKHIIPPYLKDSVTDRLNRRVSKRRQSRRVRPTKSPQFLSTIKQLNITD
jgi:hypothetical protein